jgi:hypothetical protein
MTKEQALNAMNEHRMAYDSMANSDIRNIHRALAKARSEVYAHCMKIVEKIER